VLLRDQRRAQLVVLQIELDHRARQRRALLEAEAGAERAGRDVAHGHLDLDDLELAHELLAHVEPAHEMGRHADLGEPHHEVFRDAVIEHPFARDDAWLALVVGIVLEVLHQGAGLGSLEENLGLAFVNASASHDVTLGSVRGSQ
jgi:hypothetical protein